MSSRRNARILAFQAVFGIAFDTSRPNESAVALDWLDDEYRRKFDDSTISFAKLVIRGTIENLTEIDNAIKESLNNWDFKRVSKVELAILRISVYSLLYQKDIPYTVTINEAIDITKDFAGSDSYKFINGVLDGVRKKRITK